MATSMDINRRLIESVRDEPKKLLLPISGYEKETVKSLEDACESIKDLFDQKLKQHVTIAKINSKEPEGGLSPDEAASIQLYTME
jgi:DNA integrity scanning protein DisA with diadenylate cyclase activity